jgi:hypothetical protein
VRLKKEKGVPWFTADLHDPAIVTRELNGIKQRGRFVGGVFRTEKSN